MSVGTYPPALPKWEGGLSVDGVGEFPSQCFVLGGIKLLLLGGDGRGVCLLRNMRSLRQGVEEKEVAIAGVVNKSNRAVQGLGEICVGPHPDCDDGSACSLGPIPPPFPNGKGACR